MQLYEIIDKLVCRFLEVLALNSELRIYSLSLLIVWWPRKCLFFKSSHS